MQDGISRKPNVYLVGPMGVGKTTVGKLLSDELDLEFVDIDREVEFRAGADIPWIFDVEGEEGFRIRESRALEEIVARIGKDKKRPLLQKGDPCDILMRMLELRDPLYREVATCIVQTDSRPMRQVVREIVRLFRLHNSR